VSGTLAIETQALAKRFGRDHALQGVDLKAPQGSVFVLAGANGAGKSTLFRSLLNLHRPDAGRAEVLGLDPARQGPQVRAAIGYVPEGTETGYGWLRAGELIAYRAAFHPTWDHAYAARLAHLLSIDAAKSLRGLSKGQARRLQLLLALAWRPPMLLLDEPVDGLDPLIRDEVMGLLSEHLADTGCTVLVSTHLISAFDRLADHLGVLRKGRLVRQVSRAELEQGLRIYHADGPDGWVGPPQMPGLLERRPSLGRGLVWSIWGSERDVVARIEASGGAVRNIVRPSLEEAVVSLMRGDAHS